MSSILRDSSRHTISTDGLQQCPFYDNRLYKLLANRSTYSHKLLQRVNRLLHVEPELAQRTHENEGSYFHVVVQRFDDSERCTIAFRLVYALSNAGADPNVVNGKGNTPLHEVVTDTSIELIQALFRVGVDPSIVNRDGKTAVAYLDKNSPLASLYEAYGAGIWSAMESRDSVEVKRLMHGAVSFLVIDPAVYSPLRLGFIKVDCKHHNEKSLLERARDLDCPIILRVLADCQITTELLHSILACDWERMDLIYQREHDCLNINAYDSVHRLTWMQTHNRGCSKSLIEYCLDTSASQPFDILFNTANSKVDVNVLCADGLPFFFHCFHVSISSEVRERILLHANMSTKSTSGDTFLFHLIHLYIQNEDSAYLELFRTILHRFPLLLAKRNEQDRTIIELMELAPAWIYTRLRPFYTTVMNVLMSRLDSRALIERLILQQFGHHLFVFVTNKCLTTSRETYEMLTSLKSGGDLFARMSDLIQAIVDDDLITFENLCQKNPGIHRAKDWSGRTCAHVAVLHQRYTILK